ncbi:hypothetical protein ACS5PJ_13710 [Pseudarthrobacter sp. YS3]
MARELGVSRQTLYSALNSQGALRFESSGRRNNWPLTPPHAGRILR